MNMAKPPQKFFVGELIRVHNSRSSFRLNLGDVGIVVDAFCHEVCVKSGLAGVAPEHGGAEMAMEWGYVAQFGDRQTRIDGLSPVEIVA